MYGDCSLDPFLVLEACRIVRAELNDTDTVQKDICYGGHHDGPEDELNGHHESEVKGADERFCVLNERVDPRDNEGRVRRLLAEASLYVFSKYRRPQRQPMSPAHAVEDRDGFWSTLGANRAAFRYKQASIKTVIIWSKADERGTELPRTLTYRVSESGMPADCISRDLPAGDAARGIGYLRGAMMR